MLGACKAPRRTMSEIAQGSLIPTDCALFVAVVQRCTRKKRNLTVDSSGQLASSSCHNYLSLSYSYCSSPRFRLSIVLIAEENQTPRTFPFLLSSLFIFSLFFSYETRDLPFFPFWGCSRWRAIQLAGFLL